MKRQSILFLLLLAIVGIGCSGSEPERPNTVAATGKVTYNGEAVEGATVTFVPQDGGHAAVGVTDATGAFSLMTFVANDGAVPGSYQVKIAKFDASQQAPAADTDGLSEDQMPSNDIASQASAPKNLLPVKYANTSTSGITETVGESAEENVFELALSD